MALPRDRSTRMGTESIGKLLLEFSLPAMLAMFVTASYNIVDSIFIGRLGSEALAALSVAFPLQMIIGAVGIGTGVGAASLISRSLGAGDPDRAAQGAGQLVPLALGFSVVAVFVGVFALEPVLILFGATPEIMEPTSDYMFLITVGAVLFFGIMMLNNVVRAEGNPIFSMKVLILSALINIALDPLFIFGWGFFPALGVQGAAVATLLAKGIGVALLLWYFLTGRSELHFRIDHLVPDFGSIVEIYRIGFPMMLMQVATNVSLIVANNILGAFGYVPIAVMGLIIRLQMFAFMPVVGIIQGLLPIIGYNFGAGKRPRVREAMFKAARAGTGFFVLVGGAFFAFPEVFLRIFSSEPELLAVGERALRIMVLMYPVIAIQMVSLTFFQGIGKGLPSLVLSVLREFLVYIPLMVLLSSFWGLTGVWAARPVADAFSLTVALTFLVKEFKRQKIPLLGDFPDEEAPDASMAQD